MIGNIQIWCLVIATVVGLAHGSGVCSLPKRTGPCRGRLIRYFFNNKSQQCEIFVYGGCLGNGNRFATRSQCQATCGSQTPKGPCTLPKAVGPCRARISRYFYNSNVRKCQLFQYGGCLGNANNFRTKYQCRRQCP